MKVTREKTENSQAYLTIEIEPSEVEEALEKSYRHLVKKTNIPGFRKGKAPRALLERHIGKERLFDEALNTLIPETYEKAVAEQEMEPFAQPQIEITQTNPLVFKAVVPLPPTVELGDLKDIKATAAPVEVTEDNINSTIEQLRHQHAIWEPVERAVAPNDLVVMDIESSIDGQTFINQKGAQFQVVTSATLPAPGFSQQLVGTEIGGEREFQLEFPSDYPREDMVGKTASFRVKIQEVKQEKLPKLTDEFARAVNREFTTLDVLREHVASNLRLRAEEKARIDLEEEAIEAAVKLAKAEFPPVLVDVEIDRLLNQQLQRWQAGGLDEYLKAVRKKEEELRDELRPLAMERVTRSLVMGKITEEERIEVTDAEIDTGINEMIKSSPEEKESSSQFLDSPQGREAVRRSLITKKTILRLVEIATGGEGESSAP